MLKTGIFISALLSSALCRAQCDTTALSSSGRIRLNLSYNSTLIYPGASIGAELPVKYIEVRVSENQKAFRCFTKERFLSANLNWYHHPEFHDNVYLTAEWGMRRTRQKGFISEISFGPGFSRTFLGGTTYRVSDNGNVSVIRNAGYNYALIMVGGGFGYDFSLKKKIPVAAIGRMNIIAMFPYNSTIYFRPVVKLGIRYTPFIKKANK